MEDKAIKNMVATEFVYNYIKDKRTVGVIREFPERNLAEVAPARTHSAARPDGVRPGRPGRGSSPLTAPGAAARFPLI